MKIIKWSCCVTGALLAILAWNLSCYAQTGVGWAKQGVVSILAMDSVENTMYCGQGSGFGVGEVGKETDVFITNRHVVYEETTNRICPEIYIQLDDGGAIVTFDEWGGAAIECDQSKLVRCEVLYPQEDDPEFPDFAILRAERPIEGRIALPICSSRDLADGTNVFAIGYPSDGDDILSDFSGNERIKTVAGSIDRSTLTDGVVSRAVAFPYAENTMVIQHTAQINHGNSGGPLVLKDGTVIGINTYGVYEYQMAVFTDYAMSKLNELGIHYESSITEKTPKFPIVILIGAAACAAFIFIIKKRTAARTNPTKKEEATNPNDLSKETELRLLGESGFFAGRRFAITEIVRLGRDPEQNNLVYPADTKGVSGRHCKLTVEDGALYLEDCNSTYGTFFNHSRLQSGQRVRLQVGDTFYLGLETESFRISESRKQ